MALPCTHSNHPSFLPLRMYPSPLNLLPLYSALAVSTLTLIGIFGPYFTPLQRLRREWHAIYSFYLIRDFCHTLLFSASMLSASIKFWETVLVQLEEAINYFFSFNAYSLGSMRNYINLSRSLLIHPGNLIKVYYTIYFATVQKWLPFQIFTFFFFYSLVYKEV